MFRQPNFRTTAFALVCATLVLLFATVTPAQAQPPFRLGIVVTPLEGGAGLLVDSVSPASHGATLELKPGDRLLLLGVSAVTTEEELEVALDNAVREGRLRMIVARKSGGLVMITAGVAQTAIWPPELSRYVLDSVQVMPVSRPLLAATAALRAR